MRWVIFDSVSYIFLWRRYASKSQRGEIKLSVSSPEEVGQQFAKDLRDPRLFSILDTIVLEFRIFSHKTFILSK